MAIYYGSNKVAGSGSDSGISELIQLVKDLSSKIDSNYDNMTGSIEAIQTRIETGNQNDNILDYSLMLDYSFTSKDSVLSCESIPCDFCMIIPNAKTEYLPETVINNIRIPPTFYKYHNISSVTLTVPEKSTFYYTPTVTRLNKLYMVPYKSQKMDWNTQYTSTIERIFNDDNILSDYLEPISAVYSNVRENEFSDTHKVTDWTTGRDVDYSTRNLKSAFLILKAKKDFNIGIKPYRGKYGSINSFGSLDRDDQVFSWPSYKKQTTDIFKPIEINGTLRDDALYSLKQGEYIIIRAIRAGLGSYSIKFASYLHTIKIVPNDMYFYNP